MAKTYSNKVAKKHTKKTRKKSSALKTLHGALKSLLQDTTTESMTFKKKVSVGGGVKHNEIPVLKENGVVYIMSKENVLIPRLSDDEIMAKHKKADETMKTVWNNIIDKYENLDDQGDLIDLQKGEILEDNGHIRNLGQNGSIDEKIRYKSTLKGLIPTTDGSRDGADDSEEDNEFSVWQDDASKSDASEDSSDESFTSNSSSDEESDSDVESTASSSDDSI
ncbi:hypothetical protein KAFR_0B01070 [Kazachstania africana CBS 2517]|uniref:Uncharacterized protein n=1 Tax=Kazachstania africana (strain ATCC 22294 / BCRC 22015 / CBS 2517 / CECT 1963 / NBRC 1671 / NRRL Y-8276) TaxID=1071382 RepID=H2APV5_KAZAF|nr:hypothetical protein KAFR_0B01070 [Kazachstania africana CBS 2517]CCF56405.1 hypothetical protein KAFR_0B01070 [Kazachstania africana CBS 2517]